MLGRQGAGISSEIETQMSALPQPLNSRVVRGLASRLRLKLRYFLIDSLHRFASSGGWHLV